MKKTKLELSKRDVIGKVDKRLAGQFIEIHRNCIYDGVYQPGHPLSDENGLRTDLIEEIKNLKVPFLRTGGNYVSNYHFAQAIGPKENRPKRIEMAWHRIDPMEFGTDEFLDFTNKCNMDAGLTVNLGTGTPEEAAQWVEYCNVEGGTYYSDLRKKYGHPDPYNLKTWYVGNEMDGDWQIGFLSPEQYGRKARHACDMMRWTDPNVELVICGTCTERSPQTMEWDRIVLEECYDKADMVSMHEYYAWPGEEKKDLYLASYARMDRFINKIIAACDYVKARKQSKKTMYISFDEYAVQCETRTRRPEEYRYNPGMIDILALGGMLCTLVNHADRVKIAGQTMLVNALSILFTHDKGTLRSGYYPLIKELIDCADGSALKVTTDAEILPVEEVEAQAVAAAAVWKENKEELSLVVVNLTDEERELELNLGDFGKDLKLVSAEEIISDDEDTPNTVENPDKLMPKKTGAQIVDGKIVLKGSSWNLLKFS